MATIPVSACPTVIRPRPAALFMSSPQIRRLGNVNEEAYRFCFADWESRLSLSVRFVIV